MTVQEAIDYINAHTWSQWKLGLSRTRDLLALLGNPQKQLRFVHVAGSNGKGSTCAMVERILREAGFVTGFYPSPYIEDFRERIQICGEYIPEEALCRITEQVRCMADGMEDHPTQFELITAIGMVYFAEKKCDLVVLEVGLGGIFDSTNIIDAPEVAVITNIGLEHTEYLGSTLAEIAGNKCGIIKRGSDVVCYENTPEVMEVVRRVCAEKGCPLHIAGFDRILPVEHSLEGQTFYYRSENSRNENSRNENSVVPESEDGRGVMLRLSLTGEYQLHNAVTALTVIDALRVRGFRISEDAVREGLARVQWPARFEVLSRNPLFILDGGHNPQCAEALAESIRRYLPEQAGIDGKKGKIVFLMGMLADKDYRRVIDIISPSAAAFVCLTPDSPRALPAEDLAEELTKRGFSAVACRTAGEGIRTALSLAGDLREKEFSAAARNVSGYAVISFGSLYMAGAVRHAFPAVLRNYLISCKKGQRKTALRRRRSLTEQERAEKSAMICRLLEGLEELRSARTVFSYAAAPDEVNLDVLNRTLEEQGKRVCYPLCGRGGRMSAMVVSEGTDAWRTGAYGIREPLREKASEVDPGEIDTVLVPCIVFDRQGGRCGHGAGYYDRFLEKLSPGAVKILIAFDAQEAAAVPMEETDIWMDLTVTESGILVHHPSSGHHMPVHTYL